MPPHLDQKAHRGRRKNRVGEASIALNRKRTIPQTFSPERGRALGVFQPGTPVGEPTIHLHRTYTRSVEGK